MDHVSVYAALINGEFDDVVKYLKSGVDVNAKDEHGEPIILFASKVGNLSVVRTLIELGADVNFSENQKTPLHYATIAGHVEVIRALIQAGADIDAKSDTGNTALHYAAIGTGKKGQEIIKLLVEFAASLDISNNEGDTPSHTAAKFGTMESLLFLVENGANPYIKNKYGSTVIDLVDKKWKTKIMAAHAEYQNRIALKKIKDVADKNSNPIQVRKSRSI